MRFTLEKPAAVQEAAAAKNGMNAFGEIGVFILVFMMAILGEVILMIPMILILSFSNPNFLGDFFNISTITTEDGVMGFEFSLSSFSIGGDDSLIIISLFATLAMIGVVLLFCKRNQKRSMRTLGFVKEDVVKQYLKGLIFGFVMFSAAVLICIITGSLTFDGLSESFAPSLFLLFVIGFLIQGLAEEVLLRGYFLVSFGRRHSMWAAVLVNSLIFAAIHLLNSGISILAIVNLTLFGIFASVYFVKSGNIWGIGALHGMWNLIQGNFYGIKVSGIETSTSVLSTSLTKGRELINGEAFGLEGGLAVTLVVALGTLLLFQLYPAASKG